MNRINEIINNYKNKGSRFSPANPPLQTRPQLIADPGPRAAPPPGFITQPPTLPPPQTVNREPNTFFFLVSSVFIQENC